MNRRLLVKTFRHHKCDKCSNESEWLIKAQVGTEVDLFILCDNCFKEELSDLW